MNISDKVFMMIIAVIGFLCFLFTKDGWAMGCFLGCMALDICYLEFNHSDEKEEKKDITP